VSWEAGRRDASDLDHCLLVVLHLKIPGPRYRTDSDLELSVSHGEFDDVREMDDPGPETVQTPSLTFASAGGVGEICLGVASAECLCAPRCDTVLREAPDSL